MAINEMVPLAGQGVDLGRSALSGAVAGNALMRMAEQRRNAPLEREAAQMTLESGRLALSKEKAVEQLRRAAFDAQGIRTSLASGDINRGLAQLKQRKADIIARDGANADTSHTDGWIAALESGDPAQIQGFAAELNEIEQAYQQYGGGGGTQVQPSFGQPVEVIGPDGKPTFVQVDKAGNQKPMTGYSPVPDASAGASYGQPVAGIGPDGNPMYMRFDKNGNMVPVQGFQPPPRTGMEIVTNPDGTMTYRTGVAGGGEGGLTNPTKNKVQEALLESSNSIARLGDIQSQFNPRWLQWQSQYGAKLANIKDKIGMLAPESPEAADLEAYTTFTASASQQVADRLKAMSGGAVTPEEAKRQMGYLPDPENDGPTAFKSKLERQIKFEQQAAARMRYALNNGLDQNAMYAIPLGSMPDIIRARGKEMEASGMSPEQVIEVLRQEFGQ